MTREEVEKGHCGGILRKTSGAVGFATEIDSSYIAFRPRIVAAAHAQMMHQHST